MKSFNRQLILSNVMLQAAILQFLIPEFTALAAPIQEGVSYLDPGTGSILTQLIIASILGVLVAIKAFWPKIKQVFRKSGKSNKEENDRIPE